MIRLGIVTVYGEYNYGNKLQNYAVKRIYEKMGFEVFTFKVFQSALKKDIKEQTKGIIKKIISFLPYNNKYRFERIRYDRFRKFSEKYLNTIYNNFTDSISSEIASDFDVISVGSDQVWNDHDFDTCDLNYYTLKIFSNTIKISFASSLGKDVFAKENVELFKSELSKFSYLSCREYTGANYISGLIGKECKVCIDPTLFITKEEWCLIEKKPEWLNTDNYSLLYFLGGYENKTVEKYTCGDIVDIMNSNKIMFTTSPEEFIYLIHHAKIVLTDSFHACVFSFIYGKQFLAFDREWEGDRTNSRINSLLNMFKLTQKYYNSIDFDENSNTDYSIGYKILEDEKEKFYKDVKSVLYKKGII